MSAYYEDGEETFSDAFIVGPTAHAGGPYQGQVGASLEVSGVNSADRTSTIASYSWNWGDTTADTTSASPTASHTYDSAGTFTVTLVVTDLDGASHSASTAATIVFPVGPVAPNSPNPPDGTIWVTVRPTLSWRSADANSYDVRLGTANPPPMIVSDTTDYWYYSPQPLDPGTRYFWQIVAKNSSGTTSGPIWTFSTDPTASEPLRAVSGGGLGVNPPTPLSRLP